MRVACATQELFEGGALHAHQMRMVNDLKFMSVMDQGASLE